MVKYAFIDSLRGEYAVTKMCRWAHVSRSGYYKWRTREPSDTELRRLEAERLLINLFTRFKSRYGSPRMTVELNESGVLISENTVAKLMAKQGLMARNGKGYKYFPDVLARNHVSDNLLKRNFQASKPNEKWVSDITYLRVGASFKYLFLVTDAYSRKIVGWHLGNSLESKWAVEALRMAIGQCPHTRGLVHHSDRGFQYCSKVYTEMLEEAGISPSMGEAGNCYDNALAERVNGILKTEYLLDRNFKTLKDALAAVKHAVWAYNVKRPHMSLNMNVLTKIKAPTQSDAII